MRAGGQDLHAAHAGAADRLDDAQVGDGLGLAGCLAVARAPRKPGVQQRVARRGQGQDVAPRSAVGEGAALPGGGVEAQELGEDAQDAGLEGGGEGGRGVDHGVCVAGCDEGVCGGGDGEGAAGDEGVVVGGEGGGGEGGGEGEEVGEGCGGGGAGGGEVGEEGGG